VRFVDVVFRGGHLSEQALIEAVMTGERPLHLERCESCAGRAVHLGRWLDEVRATGLEAAETAFPPERLAAQQQQILRKLEQLDTPTRVIAFPSQPVFQREPGGRRVAAGWVAVAAAAGIVVGVVSGQATALLTSPPGATPPATAVAGTVPQSPSGADVTPVEAPPPSVPETAIAQNPLLLEEVEHTVPDAMASLMPRQRNLRLASLSTTGGR
jgi:hypothetical protein